jgi:hypothetical protein
MKIATLFFTLFLISCNSNSQKTDTDTVPDKDSALNDADTETVDDLSDGVLTESDDISDADSATECLPPLIDAKFPYYDKDSNITFCRPGCDTPTEKDPQCMTNLWKEQNDNLCHEYPEYDCCGYPCILESLKPMTKEEVDEYYQLATIPMHKCDLKISPKDWGIGGSSVMKSWNMSENKIGFYLYTVNLSMKDWPVKTKFSTYEIDTKKFNFILPARGQEQAYYKGSRIALVSDKRNLELNNSNIFLAYIGDDGSYHLAYNKPVNFLAYEPALNDKWAFVNLQETENSPYKMMYAKVGDPASLNSTADSWKWTELGEGLGASPAISGNNLSVTDENYSSYVCDLSKNPKSFEGCFKMNEGDEKISYLYFDKENGNRMVFSQKLNNNFKIILAEKEGDTYKRTDLITDFTDATSKYAYSIIPKTLRGNVLLYEEVAVVDGEGSGLLCYYRIDKKRKYCMKKMEKDTEYNGVSVYPYGDAEFEGKWLLYQKLNSTPLILRDMDCYCKEEGICPFEE